MKLSIFILENLISLVVCFAGGRMAKPAVGASKLSCLPKARLGKAKVGTSLHSNRSIKLG